jgi:hypothetical protein
MKPLAPVTRTGRPVQSIIAPLPEPAGPEAIYPAANHATVHECRSLAVVSEEEGGLDSLALIRQTTTETLNLPMMPHEVDVLVTNVWPGTSSHTHSLPRATFALVPNPNLLPVLGHLRTAPDQSISSNR